AVGADRGGRGGVAAIAVARPHGQVVLGAVRQAADGAAVGHTLPGAAAVDRVLVLLDLLPVVVRRGPAHGRRPVLAGRRRLDVGGPAGLAEGAHLLRGGARIRPTGPVLGDHPEG